MKHRYAKLDHLNLLKKTYPLSIFHRENREALVQHRGADTNFHMCEQVDKAIGGKHRSAESPPADQKTGLQFLAAVNHNKLITRHQS